MTEIPEFETERLFLRGVRLEDADSYEHHFADYEVIRHLAQSVPWPYPKGGVKAFLVDSVLPRQGRDRWVWAIFLKDRREQVIGCVDLWRQGCPEHRGFWLGKSYWGQGFMTEAVTPVMDYAFTELGFERLVFANAAGNRRSSRVKEKTGARLLEVVPGRYVSPEYSQQEIWELTREQWLSRRTEGG